MKPRYYATAISWVGAAVGMRLAENAEYGPASWCFTCLSDIIVPASTLPVSPPPAVSLPPGPLSLSAGPLGPSPASLSGTPLIPSTPGPPISLASSAGALITTSGSGASTTVSSLPTPSAPIIQQIIFFISPPGGVRKRYLETRAIQGFLNNDASKPQQRCDNATVFTLASGQLSVTGTPIYYFPGDNYKELRSTGSLLNGAISTTFTVSGGILQFSNSSIPGGRADFCQDDTGHVYLTFTSSPINCQPVILVSFAVELCQNGQIVGTSLPRPASTPATDASSVRTTDSLPAVTTSLSPTVAGQTTSDARLTSTGDLSGINSFYNAGDKWQHFWIKSFCHGNNSQLGDAISISSSEQSSLSATSEAESTSGPMSIFESETSVSSATSTAEEQDTTQSSFSSETESTTSSSTAQETTDSSSTSLEVESSTDSSTAEQTTSFSSTIEAFTTSESSTSESSTSESSSSTAEETTSTSSSSTAEETTTSSSSSSSSTTEETATSNGVEYAVYFFNEGSPTCDEILSTVLGSDPLTLNLADMIQGRIPQVVGVTDTTFGFSYNPPQLFYNSPVPPDSPNCFVIDHRGYLVVSDDTDYTFQLGEYLDDLIYVWIGDAALSGGFDPSNTVIRQSFGTYHNSQFTYTFNSGTFGTTYIPIRLFYSNVRGGGQFSVSVTEGSRSTPEFSTCSMEDNVPFWLPWEQEQVKQISTTTSSSSSTSSSSTSSSSSSSSTSSTASATPTPVCSPGLEFGVYLYPMTGPECAQLLANWRSKDPNALDLALMIQGRVPQGTGRTQLTAFTDYTPAGVPYNGGGRPVSIFGYTSPVGADPFNTCYSVQERGFLELPGAGTYTFNVINEQDDNLYVWIGDSAVSGTFYPANSQLRKLFESDNNKVTTYTTTVTATQKYLPIRIYYANRLGPAYYNLAISGPTGSQASLVQCSGTQVAPDYLPWENERVGAP
ncbi:hypothetical protein LA080_011757 [Diaporthe eres]|nr:hypothetical protein LA080_011757 [Diaporthe eres]